MFFKINYYKTHKLSNKNTGPFFAKKPIPKLSRNPKGTLFTLSTSIFSHFTQILIEYYFSLFDLFFPFAWKSWLTKVIWWKREKQNEILKEKMNLTEVSRSYVIGKVPVEVEKALKTWLARFPTGKGTFFIGIFEKQKLGLKYFLVWNWNRTWSILWSVW